MFPYSNSNKRYHTLDFHLKQTFGTKVVKVPLNAGFTCPNIDGSKGYGGCTYCSDVGSGDFAGNPEFTLKDQFEETRALTLNKWNNTKYIAYFQAHTNTYAPLPMLKHNFEQALSFANVVGLSIATRADCLSDEVVDYLSELNQRTYLIVELGLQTIHDETAHIINRCHSYQDFLSGFNKLYEKGIRVCVHVINGLPKETKHMMLETVNAVAHVPIHSIKIHLLHVLKDTVIAKQLENHEFELLELDDYVNLVCDEIELLPPQIVIQRITGDGDKNKLIGPLWSLDKRKVLNEIDKELARRNTYQGAKFFD